MVHTAAFFLLVFISSPTIQDVWCFYVPAMFMSSKGSEFVDVVFFAYRCFKFIYCWQTKITAFFSFYVLPFSFFPFFSHLLVHSFFHSFVLSLVRLLVRSLIRLLVHKIKQYLFFFDKTAFIDLFAY